MDRRRRVQTRAAWIVAVVVFGCTSRRGTIEERHRLHASEGLCVHGPVENVASFEAYISADVIRECHWSKD